MFLVVKLMPQEAVALSIDSLSSHAVFLRLLTTIERLDNPNCFFNAESDGQKGGMGWCIEDGDLERFLPNLVTRRTRSIDHAFNNAMSFPIRTVYLDLL
jgi:hypothetical protein